MATRSNKQSRMKALMQLVNLTPEELAHLPKPRDGFAAHAEALLKLYAQHQGEITIKGQTPADAAAELQAYERLLEMERAALTQLTLITATRALRASGVWGTMLDIYAGALAVGRNDVEMLRSIADFVEFMKTGPHRKSGTGATTP